MATGISKKEWEGTAASLPDDDDFDIALTYRGKQEESDILSLSPAIVTQLWARDTVIEPMKRLYYGDNLPLLAHLLHVPSIKGQVKLVYIDPPFATRSVFRSRQQQDAYQDLLVGSRYMEFLRERLIFLRELLSDDGSIYVHLDDNMAFHAKLLMDEVFGKKNFRNWITRKKCNPKNYTRKSYGNVSDFILFYTKSDDYTWNRSYEAWTVEKMQKEYQYVESETGRRYKKVPIHAPGIRQGTTGQPWRGMVPPPGKHWQYTPHTLDEMDARGEIYWSPTGNPRRKVYLDESPGIAVQDIWLEFRDAHNQNIKGTGYPTEKNPALLARIVEASSNPGDLVLDCFAGSGTTLAVADHLERRWIGIDNSPEAIAATLRRFAGGLEPLGDFVSQRLPPSPDPTSLESLPLFELLTPPLSPEIVPPTQRISDFALLIAEGYGGELDALLQTWEGR